jgi:hypothetical protein
MVIRCHEWTQWPAKKLFASRFLKKAYFGLLIHEKWNKKDIFCSGNFFSITVVEIECTVVPPPSFLLLHVLHQLRIRIIDILNGNSQEQFHVSSIVNFAITCSQ